MSLRERMRGSTTTACVLNRTSICQEDNVNHASEAAPNGELPGLVIVESPKKARSINKFLGSAYLVKASMGHVRDLPKRKLGLDVADSYRPSYEIVPAKKETISDLKRAAARADLVYLATDP